MKELKDFIHLYVGCKVQWIRSDGNIAVQELTLSDAAWLRERKDAKLILRPIESLVDDEIRELIQYDKVAKEYKNLVYEFFPHRKEIEIQWSVELDEGGSYPQNWTLSLITMNAHDFSWCLKKGLDLFGLHAAGLCVYENEVKG